MLLPKVETPTICAGVVHAAFNAALDMHLSIRTRSRMLLGIDQRRPPAAWRAELPDVNYQVLGVDEPAVDILSELASRDYS